jgi:hypothetical protein
MRPQFANVLVIELPHTSKDASPCEIRIFGFDALCCSPDASSRPDGVINEHRKTPADDAASIIVAVANRESVEPPSLWSSIPVRHANIQKLTN